MSDLHPRAGHAIKIARESMPKSRRMMADPGPLAPFDRDDGATVAVETETRLGPGQFHPGVRLQGGGATAFPGI